MDSLLAASHTTRSCSRPIQTICRARRYKRDDGELLDLFFFFRVDRARSFEIRICIIINAPLTRVAAIQTVKIVLVLLFVVSLDFVSNILTSTYELLISFFIVTFSSREYCARDLGLVLFALLKDRTNRHALRGSLVVPIDVHIRS